jgi:hypothetical protein
MAHHIAPGVEIHEAKNIVRQFEHAWKFLLSHRATAGPIILHLDVHPTSFRPDAVQPAQPRTEMPCRVMCAADTRDGRYSGYDFP